MRSRCVEQRVEIVDERLHLGRIVALDARDRVPSCTAAEPRAQLRRCGDSPRRTCSKPDDHADDARSATITEPCTNAVEPTAHPRMARHDVRQREHDAGDSEQADRPEDRAASERAPAATSASCAAPIR